MTLDELIREFGDDGEERKETVAKDILLASQRGTDIELLGAAFVFITEPKFSWRVAPPLTLDEYVEFTTQYLERCLLDNPNGEWAHSRYEAGHAIVNIFVALWKNESVPRNALEELRDWLGRLYLEGDEELRVALVTATLEHLFESRTIKTFFASWKTRPLLDKAYDDAVDWARFHPNLDHSIFDTDF